MSAHKKTPPAVTGEAGYQTAQHTVHSSLEAAGIHVSRLVFGENRAPCPQCDRGPRDTALSVRVDTDVAVWHCYRCDWRGSTRSANAHVDPAEIARQQRIREQETERRHQSVARECRRIWMRCWPADPAHPYLKAKGIRVYGIRQDGDRLVLPLIDTERRIWSLQTIGLDGEKRLHPGGRKRGNFIPLYRPADPVGIVIAEGVSTAASLIPAFTEYRVIAAVDAYNMRPVCEALVRHHVGEIILAADPDPAGLAGARAAAAVCGGRVIAPDWPEDAPDKTGDFADLAAWLKGVRHVA